MTNPTHSPDSGAQSAVRHAWQAVCLLPRVFAVSPLPLQNVRETRIAQHKQLRLPVDPFADKFETCTKYSTGRG